MPHRTSDRRSVSKLRCGKRRQSLLVGSLYARRLRVETLEDRRLLAVFPVSNLDDFGSGSLREAIGLANSAPGADEIVFEGAGAAGTINLTTGELLITESLTITGPGEDVLSVQGSILSRILNFTTGDGTGDLNLSGLTLTGGVTVFPNFVVDDVPMTLFSGGGIRFLSSGQLTVSQSTIDGNHTIGDRAPGGGIFTESGTIVINDSTISNNSTSGLESSGGGVYSRHGNVHVNNTFFFKNRTLGEGADGAGVSTFDGNIEINDSLIQFNDAMQGSGGAIAMRGGDLLMSRGFVTDNTADNGTGGAIGVRGTSSVTINHSVLSRNSTINGEGGAISLSSDSFLLNDSVVSNNRAKGNGGIDMTVSEAVINRSTVSDNLTSGLTRGGGIRHLPPEVTSELILIDSDVSRNVSRGAAAGVFSAGSVRLIRSSVNDNIIVMHQNTISGGGGIDADGDVTLIDSTVRGNVKPGTGQSARGGGINSRGLVTLLGSTVSDNVVESEEAKGGGINASKGVRLVNSTVSGNQTIGAQATGGGISAGSIRVISSTVTGNRSGGAGGGIILSGFGDSDDLTIVNSIVAGNLRNISTTSQPNDLTPAPTSTVRVNQSLIGVNTSVNLIGGAPNPDGNYVGTLAEVGLIDPLLGPLADNGGPTLPSGAVIQTHALLPGSPAINTGPVATAEPLFDYRLDSFADFLAAGDDLTTPGGTGTFNNGIYQISNNQGLRTQIPTANADIYSLELYVKFDFLNFTNDYQKILDFGTDEHPFAGLYVYTDQNGASRLRYVANPSNGGFFTGGTQLDTDTWYQLVLTRDDSATNPVSLYIDGQFERNYPLTADVTHTVGLFNELGDSSATRLLTMFHSDSNPLFGLPRGGAVDRIRFYDRPLNAVEIDDLFDAGPSHLLTEFDQRGANFARIVGGRMDMGAFELQVSPSADFDGDGDIDGADFLAWQRGFGITVGAAKTQGDANLDGAVNADDLAIWSAEYGQQPFASTAVRSGQTAASRATLADESLIDATIVLLSMKSESKSMTDGAATSGEMEVALPNETASDLIFASNTLQPNAGTADEGILVVSQYEAEAEEDAWLANELLERVFG